LKRARPDDCEEASSENVTQIDHPTGTKKFRTVSVGWLNTVTGRLVQVRANKGGGTRNIRVPAMATKREIVAEAQKLFFPAGVSGIGNQADFAFDLVDVQHCPVSDGVTVASLYDSTRTCGNLRFSITTTQLVMALLLRPYMTAQEHVGISDSQSLQHQQRFVFLTFVNFSSQSLSVSCD